MKPTVKRALWQRTLKATVLRQPLPKAPPPEWESFLGRMQAIVDRGEERKRQQARTQRQRDEAARKGIEFLSVLGRAIAEMNRPRSMRHLVDAFIAGTADEPGELDHLAAFQRFPLGEPTLIRYSNPSGRRSPLLERFFGNKQKQWWQEHFDLSQGGEHQGDFRLVGERGPELSIKWPRRPGKDSLQCALALAAVLPYQQQLMAGARESEQRQVRARVIEAGLAQWQRDLGSDGEGDSCD